MAFKVTCKFEGAKEFAAMCRKFPGKLRRELVQATEKSGQYLTVKVHERFGEQGPGWRNLSPAYEKWKQEQGFDSRILLRTTKLFSAIKYRRLGFNRGMVGVDPGGYGGIGRYASPWKKKNFKRLDKKVMKLHMERATFEEVARRHELGGSRIPARPFFGPTALKEARMVMAFYAKALEQALIAARSK
jgi:hypothetical protein